MSISAGIGDIPGSLRRRADVPVPAAYAVFDCETTGTTPGVDKIVSLAALRLDANGAETARFARLVRPSRRIPAEATAVHGISDEDVACAPSFGEIARELLNLLEGAVFVAHNALFDLGMLQHAFACAGVDYRPAETACTLDAFRLIEPLAEDRRLHSICERHGIVLEDAHEALSDVLATVALLRVLLDEGIAPETVELDHAAFLRLRSRGDTRPASERQSASRTLPRSTARWKAPCVEPDAPTNTCSHRRSGAKVAFKHAEQSFRVVESPREGQHRSVEAIHGLAAFGEW